MATTGLANGQFLRYAQLIVKKGAQGLDLSNLRFRFEVRAADTETLNTMVVRVYNPTQNTVNSVVQEFDSVILTAGYQTGNQGNIFQGDIKQFRFGRERNVDNYLDIMAADGDLAYNFAVMNQTFPAGTTDQQQLAAFAVSMNLPVAETANGFLTIGGIQPSPRGKVAFGMTRDYMRVLAKKNNCRWSIQNGTVTLIPNTGYLPGEAVAINSASGMIGTPEQTDNGIMVRCYLNPLINVGQAVKINNKDITQSARNGLIGFSNYREQYYGATVTNDGLYRVLVVEHVGDLRGNDFYTELTCLDIDPSSPSSASVLANG